MTRHFVPHLPIMLLSALLAIGFAPPSSSGLLHALHDDGLNRHDTERVERGYYEQLIHAGRRVDAVEPSPFDAGRLCDVVDDLREYTLKPNLTTEHRGATWTTNAQGMRDRARTDAKPPGVVRVALVGDSIGSGWGVDDGLGFAPLMETILPTVEVLNVSVPGHAPGQRWEQFRRIGWGMSPDVVLFEATPADPGWDERRLRVLLPKGVGWEAPQYRDAILASGASRGGDAESYKASLKPQRWAILENVYQAAVAECRDRKVLAAWILIPRVGKPIAQADRERLVALAKSSGFAIVADLSDAFDGIEPADLAIAPNDFHPNARGHRILADRIAKALSAAPSWDAWTEGRR